MRFVDYNNKERIIVPHNEDYDCLTRTRILHNERGTQFEVDEHGSVYRVHPCSGKRTKIGDLL
jgi:hypothetical protein